MALREAIRSPFREGSGTSPLVPAVWDCAVGGMTFMFDTKYFERPTQLMRAQFKRSSIPLLKPQQASGTINEDALNPADGARAKVESWHHGAGQTYLDRSNSDPYRFRSSKGIDPWTRWKMGLLADTAVRRASVNTNVALVPAGSRVYLADGQAVLYATSLAGSWTAVTGTPSATVTSIASDGFNVWTASTASGLYGTNTGTGAASQIVSTALTSDSVVGYVKGRLLVSKQNVLFNVIDLVGPTALPTALFTHPNTGFRWVGFAEGKSVIYAAGYAGDKSLIYKTTIKADGTALDVPTVAAEIPDGEIVRSISSYLGLVLIGTDLGVWVADQDTNGNLTINKVVDLTAAVYCFEGQGDFVWFGWTNYDGTSTGLGRMDLSGGDTKGASVVTPPYASDLMATTQGAVLSVCTFGNQRAFTVSGAGVYSESTSKVASGTLLSGLITHGMPDNKAALTVTVTHEPLNGTVALALAGDGGTATGLGSSATAGETSTTLNAGSLTAETFELTHTLTRSGSDATLGPEVTRTTLESNLAPGRGEYLNVALLLRESLTLGNGVNHDGFDCAAAYRALLAFEQAGSPVTYQDPLGTETVTLEEHDMVVEDFTARRDGFQGTFFAQFRRGRARS